MSAGENAAAGTRGQDAAQAEGPAEGETCAQEIRFLTHARPCRQIAGSREQNIAQNAALLRICPRHRAGSARGYQELFAL
jgi:hypothetical protein